jgi:hypothetical protein
MDARRPLNAEEIEALKQYASLQISFGELRRRLSRILTIEFLETEVRLSPSYDHHSKVRIERWHVENAVEKHTRREISKEQLFTWADMLLLIDAYDWEGPDEEWVAERLNELADPGDGMLVFDLR